MHIVLASGSCIKFVAAQKAAQRLRWEDVWIVKTDAQSKVSKLPRGAEILKGAENRIDFAKSRHPGADYYFAVESGVFKEGDKDFDRAVVVVEAADGRRAEATSDGLEVPPDIMRESRERGINFAQVMRERDLIIDAKDPHKPRTGRSKVDFIADAIVKAVEKLQATQGSGAVDFQPSDQ